MATKLYFHAGGVTLTGTLPTNEQSVTTPSWSAGVALSMRTMSDTIGASQTQRSCTTLATTAAQNGFIGYWASPPLGGDQTVGAGAMTLLIGDAPGNGASGFWVNSLNIYVWRPSTGTKVGTIRDATGTSLGGFQSGNNSEQTTYIAGITGSAVDAQTGDIIICELWTRHTQTMATSYTAYVYYDGPTEYTSENVPASDVASYIQFAETLRFTATFSDSVSESLSTAEGIDVSEQNNAQITENTASADEDATSSFTTSSTALEAVNVSDVVDGGVVVIVITDGPLGTHALGSMALNASSQGIHQVAAIESLILNTGATTALVFVAGRAEQAATADLVSCTIISGATATEVAALAESSIKNIITSAAVNNIAVPTDSAAGSSVRLTALSENPALADILSGLGGKDVSVTEILSALESSSALASVLASCAEVLLAQTTQSGAGTYPTSQIETTTLTEVLARAVAAARGVTEPVVPTESRTASMVAVGGSTEPVSVGHGQITVNLFTASGTETAMITDTSSGIAELWSSQVEASQASDVISAIATLVANRSEALSVSDQRLAQMLFKAFIDEQILSVDSSNRVGLSPVLLEAFIGTGMTVLSNRMVAAVSIPHITASVEVIKPITATAEVQYAAIKKAA